MKTPKIVRSIDSLRKEIAKARRRKRRIGFVPTMGYLHDGHLELVRECRKRCDTVVVSIFVNPRQFGPGEDLERYPRDLKRDRKLLTEAGCDLLFVPSAEEMYPEDFRTVVGVEDLRDKLCGKFRPGHFDGVCVVVLKLLIAVMPDVAFFGEKDYQQLVIIRRMVSDLSLPIEIVGIPTVREKDGLAMSSRNLYLTDEERSIATALYKSLELGKLMILAGERRASRIKNRMMKLLIDSGVTKVDYVAIVEPATLDDVTYIDREVRLAVAAWVGQARLIDNVGVNPAVPVRKYQKGNVAVILAAGEGKRMKSEKPKVLQTVGGKPMVEHVIDAARGAGLKQILVIVGHGRNRVEPFLRRLGVDSVIQEVQRGTGHALLQSYPALADFDGNVVVISGDTPLVTSRTIKHLVEIHTRRANAITFATAVVPDATGYGRVVRDSNGKFVRIVEEKDATSREKAIREVNAGIYCFRSKLLFDALLMVDASNVQMEYYLPDAIARIKARGGRVEPVVIEDYVEILGVNTPEELKAIRALYARRQRDENPKRGLENGIHRKGRR